MKTSLGIDLGSSSVKVSLLDIESGRCLAAATQPQGEMPIDSPRPGFAEQDPQMWWDYCCSAIRQIAQSHSLKDLACIGISYQMHGLVCLDAKGDVLRKSIIWCDSRAVETGRKALQDLGRERCIGSLLNSPGNFTASKLRWVQQNEPEIYRRTVHFCLPGDWLAYKLSGQLCSSVTGLSEQILWDFKNSRPADFLLNYYNIESSLLPEIRPAIGVQALSSHATEELLGIPEGTPISYRAGDQPNNAFSLKVLHPGEVAATAGTSGVVFGVSDKPVADSLSRVNSFVHVNWSPDKASYGVLLCINGSGILNAWCRRYFCPQLSYEQMNELAAEAPAGSDGLLVLPFGNGAERVLQDKDCRARIVSLDFKRHSLAHILRACQEGIAFSFAYGLEIMRGMGLEAGIIRAGKANMFLSDIFVHTLSATSSATIELYNTDGALGAARGAALGAGIYPDEESAFGNLHLVERVEAEEDAALRQAYENWKKEVQITLTD
ncbi:MAG: xylulokinase [Candidatus Cryptobacteroides sp.]